jgi:hypothetical protein
VCDSFKDSSLGNKYNCQIVALTKNAKEYTKLSYSNPLRRILIPVRLGAMIAS